MDGSRRHIDEARSLHRNLKAIFDSYAPGQRDARVSAKVRRLCAMANRTIDDPYCQNVLRAVNGAAHHLLSERKVDGDAAQDVGAHRLVVTLLAAYEGRLLDLEAQSPRSRSASRHRRVGSSRSHRACGPK